MPELPEVETTVRGLGKFLEGERITRVVLNRADLRRPFPADLVQVMTAATVSPLDDQDERWVKALREDLLDVDVPLSATVARRQLRLRALQDAQEKGLERLERSKVAVGAEQFQSVARHLAEEFAELEGDEMLPAVLYAYPAAAELYENLIYAHAGLCRSPPLSTVSPNSLSRSFCLRVRCTGVSTITEHSRSPCGPPRTGLTPRPRN